MIHFKDLCFRNFLSVGDQPTLIQLDKSITTVVTGDNGAGKSTFIDALVFGLFGKPYRKVRLGQLINKVNEKGLEVEVNFSIGNKDYKVIRGQKPAKFEIWVDDVMIEQPATTADYQFILENDILKLNYKTFTQIIILGSASFIPFMQLKLSDRREIIEDLLDISVFSKMNTILKSKIKELHIDINNIEHNYDLVKQDHKSKRDYLIESTQNHQKRIEDNNKIINDTKEKIRLMIAEKSGYEELINGIENSMLSCEGYEDKVMSATSKIDAIKYEISEQQNRFDLLKKNNEVVADYKKKIHICGESREKANNDIVEIDKKISGLNKIIDGYSDTSEERVKLKTEIDISSNEIKKLKVKLSFYNNNNDCDECGQKIHEDFKMDIIATLESDISARDDIIKTNRNLLAVIDKDLKDKSGFEYEVNELNKKMSLVISDVSKWKNSIKLMTDGIRSLETEDEGAMGDLKHYIGTLGIKYDDECNGVKEAKEKHIEYVGLEKQLIEVKKDLAVTETELYNHNSALVNLLDEQTKLNNTEPCYITQKDIDSLSEQVKEFDVSVRKKKHTMHYFLIVQKLLKDDGLKTKIIRKFLPIINATVNMYLDKFDFPINFEFDENFNETIQSKFRNDFSYFSFSEGEKSRIDLALLFTWRETSLKKARNATNIIIFDEIFDGSLDGNGIENFMSILGLDKAGYNSFIISHKDETINSRFDRNIIFEKNGHFSKLKEK